MTDHPTPTPPDGEPGGEPDGGTGAPTDHRSTRRTVLGAAGVGVAVLGTGWAGLRIGERMGPGAGVSPGDGPEPYAARFADYAPADEPNGDLAMVVWPDFVVEAGPSVQRLYEFQVTNGDLMRWMPCFCGCQLEDGHQNNRDCYIDTVNPDGSVVFDPMAPT